MAVVVVTPSATGPTPVYAVATARQHLDACCCGSYSIITEEGVSVRDDVRLCARRDCPHPLHAGQGSRVREIRGRRVAAMSARDPHGGWPHLIQVDVQADLLDLLGGAS